ncbi:hypothetical protein [Streptomyces sp. ISL-94]|uniref:hypothetical protein n=1 Tax=Streptomyces sp. ISL-94 TaxID=2819190 RepID=UPI001BEBED03|nr:hypothetical protein [Streptomyces sp. ISL-94]MBT2481509.1 hypothetical protein [Streptomyces sp. ISL-94]
MPRHHSAPWPRALLACLMSGLLLAAVHCSSYLSGDTHGHLSLGAFAPTSTSAPGPAPAPASTSAPASASADPQQHAPERPRHDHGAACTFPGLPAQAAQGEPPHPAGPVLALTPAMTPGQPTADAPSAAPGSRRRTAIARPGRTTLTSVCRWRI